MKMRCNKLGKLAFICWLNGGTICDMLKRVNKDRRCRDSLFGRIACQRTCYVTFTPKYCKPFL